MSTALKKALITGANGFIGKNLQLHLSERKDVQVVCFTRDHAIDQLFQMLQGVDVVFHLAGINRPHDPQEFITGNVNLTQALCDAIERVLLTSGKKVSVLYASSVQAECDNLYGQSKRTAENALFALQAKHEIPVYIFRLPNVFGKWCKPNYNSAVATFCYNIARGLPIQVNDPATPVTLLYVEDLINRYLQLMDGADAVAGKDGFTTVAPLYDSTVGELARLIHAFEGGRRSLRTEHVGAGLVRALYATYLSYLPAESFAYTVPQYGDLRGVFVEMLKTPDCGQFSYFTSHPGVTRGGHYHHSRSEKFLVVKGKARFKFRHMQTGEVRELVTHGDMAEIVETVPGWTHDITNVGDDEMVVMLWGSEVFDRARPDTFACEV